jgi:hypothetical protein
MRRFLCLVVLSALAAVPACSQSTDIEGHAATTTTRHSTETTDPLDAAAGTAAIRKLDRLIDGMLASQDPCAVLSQRDLQANQLDPSLFTTARARKAVTKGLVDVYDHLVKISPPELTGPLTAQKAVFVDVLQVVDLYATSGGQDQQATRQIDSLVSAPGYVAAQAQLTAWVSSHCR